MRIMLIYTIIPIAFVILFVHVRGGFLKASKYINRTLLSRLAVDDASVRTALVVVFCANAAALWFEVIFLMPTRVFCTGVIFIIYTRIPE